MKYLTGVLAASAFIIVVTAWAFKEPSRPVDHTDRDAYRQYQCRLAVDNFYDAANHRGTTFTELKDAEAGMRASCDGVYLKD